ncbi:autotransporter domain-containing protein [Maricaulis sp. W15]|uniref:autotransporter domain-containing protein n=1 Tax=Maricaulis sp. W15 TaxID=1772333 RepID=UPI000A756CDC|nr:autotransporter domain-containing protein [Maricaulis sp. W15]
MTCFRRQFLASTALIAALACPAFAQDITIQGSDYVGTGIAAIDANTASGDIVIDVDSVTTTGDDAPGVDAQTPDGTVDIAVSGDVSTEGERSTGISVLGFGDVNIAVGGLVSTQGYQASGVIATSCEGDISADLAGGVSTLGVAAGAVDLVACNGDITLETGDVSTTGNGSAAIVAEAVSGDAVVMADNVSTEGDFAGAVSVVGGGDVSVGLQGLVSTTGQNSTAVSVFGDTVRLGFSEVTVEGLFSSGVTAGGRVVLIEGGSIMAAGEHVAGLNVEAIDGYSEMLVEQVVTTGFDSDAVHLNMQNSNLFAAFGAVSTVGDSSTGILVESDGGRIGLIAQGVETQGFGSTGIDLQIDAADMPSAEGAARHEQIAVEAGLISTAGDQAIGISLNIGAAAEGAEFGASSIGIQADSISTSGEEAAGLRVFDPSGVGSLEVSATTVTTEGEGSDGIQMFVGARAVDLTSSGSIVTAGDDANGIIIFSDVDVSVSANEISTLGAYSTGVEIRNIWEDPTGLDPRYINVDVETASVAGRYADAVLVTSDDAHVSVRAANITALGDHGRGVAAQTGNGSVTIRVTETVTTRGNWSTGILGTSHTGRVDILANDVTVEGDYSFGIVGAGSSGAEVDITTLGDVTVTGTNATAIGGISRSNPTNPDGGGAGHVEINVFGNVRASGAIDHGLPGLEHFGHGIYIDAGSSDVSIGADGHLESTNGYAFYSADQLVSGPDGDLYNPGEDRLSISGSIAGDVWFGRGDDEFLIFAGADISGLGTTLGGDGHDMVQFSGWEGVIDPSQFNSFEELNVAENADLVIASETPVEWSLATISLSDASLRLGNGITLRGDLEVFDFDRRSGLLFFDDGASTGQLIGDIFAPDGLTISLLDQGGDDVAILTGDVDGDLDIGIDLGIGNGSLLAADQVRIDGMMTGDIVLYLSPYAASGGSFEGALVEVTGAHGDITLADGAFAWGGEVFDIDISGASASQDKSHAAAAGGTTSVSLVSLGYTPDAAGAIALPAVIDALDSSLLQGRAARRGSSRMAGDAALWGEVRFDAFEGDARGVVYDTEQTAILLGADLVNTTLENGQLTGTLMFHTAQSSTDLVQSGLAPEQLDVDTNALGFALGWTSNSSGRYLDLVAWGTDRSLELDSVKLDSQGLGASVEVGTRFDISGTASLQPLMQVVWTDAQIDSFTDASSGREITPGAVNSLHVRAGAVLSQSLSENWQLEATAIADLNRRDSGATTLATGYSDRTRLAGMGAEAGLRLTGAVGNWQVFGDVTGRWATGVDGADGVGGRVGVSRRF